VGNFLLLRSSTGSPGNLGVFVPQPGFSLSAPGGVAEGQLLTLSGSGFGSTGPQLIYYKNNANETAGSRIANGPDFLASSLASAVANGNGYPYCVSGSGLPYGLGQIYSNDSRVGTVSTGAGWGGVDITLNSVSAEVYTSIVYFFPTACNYTPLVSAGSPQLKDFWLLSPDGNTWIYHKTCNQTIALALAMDSNASGINNTTFGSNTSAAWNSSPYPKTGVPICVDRWVQLNAAAGAGTGNILWASVNDGTAQTVNVHHDNAILVSTGDTVGYTRINTPGFVQFTTATNPNWSYDNTAYIAAGEQYVAIGSSGNQGACARIEIGDAPTYAACTQKAKCTVESPSWWTGTSIQFRQRNGVFYNTGLSGKYLYVTTAGNVTALAGQFL
jgi:hypothetical protein